MRPRGGPDGKEYFIFVEEDGEGSVTAQAWEIQFSI